MLLGNSVGKSTLFRLISEINTSKKSWLNRHVMLILDGATCLNFIIRGKNGIFINKKQNNNCNNYELKILYNNSN